MRIHRRLSVFIGGCLFLATSAPAADAPSFAKDVAPIFAANCTGCHGASTRMGSLDLDSFEGLMKGGHHGTVVEPGKSQDSRLYLMIAGKATPAMPLSGNRLSAEDIETVRKWIDAGAQAPAPGEVVSAQPVIPDIRPRAAVKPEIASLAWRPDGKLLALGTWREVRLVDPATQKLVAALDGHAEVVRAVAFSPDGKQLAAAGGFPGRSGEVRLWDVDARAELRSIQGHADCIYAAAFSRDGKTLATAGYDKLIKLWDAATGKEIRTLKDHIDAVYALQFTPDGRRLVSGAADRAVKVWDVATGERLYTLSESLDGVNAVALDPQGKRVAAGGLDKTIRIWSLGEKGGRLLNSLIAHEDTILRVAWSPDGKLLASAAADRTLKIFNAADLTEIKSFPGQPDWVLALEFAPDGSSLAAGRFDGSLAVVPAAEFQPRAAAHVARR